MTVNDMAIDTRPSDELLLNDVRTILESAWLRIADEVLRAAVGEPPMTRTSSQFPPRPELPRDVPPCDGPRILLFRVWATQRSPPGGPGSPTRK